MGSGVFPQIGKRYFSGRYHVKSGILLIFHRYIFGPKCLAPQSWLSSTPMIISMTLRYLRGSGRLYSISMSVGLTVELCSRLTTSACLSHAVFLPLIATITSPTSSASHLPWRHRDVIQTHHAVVSRTFSVPTEDQSYIKPSEYPSNA